MGTLLSPLEAERLAALQSYQLLDTPRDDAFDRITAIGAEFFHVPISLISLVDENRIWFKSKHGIDVAEVERAPGLCASVILSDGAYVVTNATEDPRTRANPLVSGALGLRFYAAAPLVTPDGFRLGTFNVIDLEPREFSASEASSLLDFASLVMDQMNLRLTSKMVVASLSKMFDALHSSAELNRILTVCAWTKKIKLDDQWVSFEDFLSQRLGFRVSHGITPEAAAELLARYSSRSGESGQQTPEG